MQFETQLNRWAARATEDAAVAAELAALLQTRDEAEIADRFYCELAFGTGGLRGVLGAGANRMNIYTVRRATQGLAAYLQKTGGKSVAIAHDSRNNSALFAREAARVLAANNITAHLYETLMPTPALSYAVRALGCAAGVCVTASHNPAAYNGYKVYGADGCQITTETANAVQREIEQVDVFDGVRIGEFAAGRAAGRIHFIPRAVAEGFVNAVLAQRLTDEPNTGLNVVYTPLHGAGLWCMQRMLAATGTAHALVDTQCAPDGNFPTCPYPNPEIPEAMALGAAMAKESGADLLLATDPDCDRLGVGVPTAEGCRLLTGNEIGMLLLDYVCRMRVAKGTMPKHPVAVKTIVTGEMAKPIAAHYGVQLREVLTGFKFIGEQIGLLEAEGRADDYIFGFEESYGYLSGAHVRDKDAVNAAMLVCDLAAEQKRAGRTLPDALDALSARFGYFETALATHAFPGEAGMRDMQALMRRLREHGLPGGAETGFCDYLTKTASGSTAPPDAALPAADVLEFRVGEGTRILVRPSGTEPKLKCYLSAEGSTRAAARASLAELEALAEAIFTTNF